MAQGGLQKQIRATADEAKGKVSVACSLPGTELDCDLHPIAHPPMQSVFKLPLGMAILDQVQRGRFTIDQPIRFLATDRIPNAYSPLQGLLILLGWTLVLFTAARLSLRKRDV